MYIYILWKAKIESLWIVKQMKIKTMFIIKNEEQMNKRGF